MANMIFGAPAVVSALNRAFLNTSPTNTIYNNQVQAAGNTADSFLAFAKQFGAQFSVGKTPADLSALLLSNMGVSNEILQTALTDYIAFHGAQSVGVIAWQLSSILSGLEGDTTYGAAAKAWNQEVANAYSFSSNPANVQESSDISDVTLTRFSDVKTGSKFLGYLDYNQFTGSDEQTLTDSDRLTGDSDSDILIAFLQVNGTRPNLTGIETIQATAKANTVGLNLIDASGVKTVWNNASVETANLNFTNLNTLVDLKIQETNSDTTLTFAPTVTSGVADNVNVALNKVGITADRANVTVGANNIEKLTITSSTGPSVIGNVVTGNSLTTVDISGDADLSVGTKAGLGFNSTALTTVNAGAATGKLFLNVATAGLTNQTVTTGTSDDVVVVTGVTAKDTFDLGQGAADRVVLADAGSNEAASYANVEQVEARFGGTNINLTKGTGVNLIAVAETVGVASIANVTAVKSGTTIAFEGEGADNAIGASNVATFGSVAYNLSNATGSSDVINVTYNNAGTVLGSNGAVNIGALNNTGNNVETLNFTFSDVGSDDTVTVADINVGSALRTLNVTSDSKVVFNLVADLTALTSVDVSGVKDAFTATFGLLANDANALVKTGGAGNNNVTVGKGNGDGATNTILTVDGSAGTGSQTFTVNNTDADVSGTTASFAFIGGAGADALTLTSVLGSINNISGGAGIDNLNLAASAGLDRLAFVLGDTGSTVATGDTVTGFAAGGVDQVDLRAFGFDSALRGVSLTGALNGAANEFAGNAVAVFNNGGNSTMYIDTNGDTKLGAGDMVINFVGTNFAANDASVLFV